MREVLGEHSGLSMVTLLSGNVISSLNTHKESADAFAISHELLPCAGSQLFKLAPGLDFLWPGDFDPFSFLLDSNTPSLKSETHFVWICV